MSYRNSCFLFQYLDSRKPSCCFNNSINMTVSCEDMSSKVFYSHLQDSSTQFFHVSQMRTCYFEVFLARCQWRKWKKQSGDCKFHNNNHPQMTMFEESANRHLILSTRQQSSKIRHNRFAFCRSAICQEKVQEHSWTWMVCYFSKRDMWRPTGDLQNLSRSYLKLISSVQCIYCIKLTIKILHCK